MNKNNSMLPWILIAGLVMMWSSFKARENNKRLEEKKAAAADSIAQVQSESKSNSSSGPVTRVVKKSNPEIGAASGTLLDSTGLEAAAAIDTANEILLVKKEVLVKTPKAEFLLSNQGGGVQSIKLLDTKGYQPHQSELLPSESGGAFQIKIGKEDFANILCEMDTEEPEILATETVKSLEFKCSSEKDPSLVLTRTYTFNPDSNHFTHKASINTDYEGRFAISWPSGLNETEAYESTGSASFGMQNYFFSEVIFHNGSEVMRETFKESKTFNENSGIVKWAGLRRKYVAGIMNFDENAHISIKAKAMKSPDGPESLPTTYSLTMTGSVYEDKSFNFNFKILPLFFEDVSQYNEEYEKILFSGYSWFLGADSWFPKLCGLVLKLLKIFFGWIPNYGVAIILLTIVVRLVTFPLTLQQTKMSVKMQEHAPAIKAIREKFKKDPQAQQREMMAYYKKVGVNPLAPAAGCLPMLLQMPIFISLFVVLGRALELKGANFMLWITDLSKPDVILPALKIPYVFPEGLTILPILFAASMFFLMRQTIKDPQQKFMVWFMPLFMFVICASVPSGLVLYWTISNFFSIGQTWAFTKKGLTTQSPVTAGPS